MTSEHLHIASLLVHVRPGQLDAVSAWLSRQPDAELGGEDPAGKLVVVMESRHEGRILALIDAVQQRPGVLGAALVYHQLLDPQIADDPQEATP